MSTAPFSFGFQNKDIDEAAGEVDRDVPMDYIQPDVQPNVQGIPTATDSEPTWHTIHAMVRSLLVNTIPPQPRLLALTVSFLLLTLPAIPSSRHYHLEFRTLQFGSQAVTAA